MKYLPLYEKWMETGRMPKEGLCRSLGRRPTKIFIPTHKEFGINEWMGDPKDFLWGYDGERKPFRDNVDSLRFGFTPMRQTIVLFLAAMNNEL